MLVLWRGWVVFSCLNRTGFYTCQVTSLFDQTVWFCRAEKMMVGNLPGWLVDYQTADIMQCLAGGSCSFPLLNMSGEGPSVLHYASIHCMRAVKSIEFSMQTPQLHFALWRPSLGALAQSNQPSALACQLVLCISDKNYIGRKWAFSSTWQWLGTCF